MSMCYLRDLCKHMRGWSNARVWKCSGIRARSSRIRERAALAPSPADRRKHGICNASGMPDAGRFRWFRRRCHLCGQRPGNRHLQPLQGHRGMHRGRCPHVPVPRRPLRGAGMMGVQLSLFGVERPEPFKCPHETSVADIGDGKSLCEVWGMWTNCREVGHCTAMDGDLERFGEGGTGCTRSST